MPHDRYPRDTGDPYEQAAPYDAPVDGPEVERHVAEDVAAAATLDPLDMLDEHWAREVWSQFGGRLLTREAEVRAEADLRGWAYEDLDPELSARLVEGGVVAGCPRVTRNVCRLPGDDSVVVADLTEVVRNLDGFQSDWVRLRGAGIGVVPFPAGGRRLVVLPRPWPDYDWRAFGRELPTESAEFDRAYALLAHDDAWTALVLNPAVMARLLDHRPVTLVVAGGWLAVVVPDWVRVPGLAAFADLARTLAYSAAAARSS